MIRQVLRHLRGSDDIGIKSLIQQHDVQRARRRDLFGSGLASALRDEWLFLNAAKRSVRGPHTGWSRWAIKLLRLGCPSEHFGYVIRELDATFAGPEPVVASAGNNHEIAAWARGVGDGDGVLLG